MNSGEICKPNVRAITRVTIISRKTSGPRAGPGPLGPRAPGILPPLPPPLDGPDHWPVKGCKMSYSCLV
ncbi:unnamed protein product [Nesidiocoris tenuis]|uniref:Uncharacterized protein n=1 Tax=Nesidiocoris tenuis TaxID=355587 RepID=A0A6H5GV92_9HEMI|nr:unnamed protein product [Nesidiocoris tenuis]